MDSLTIETLRKRVMDLNLPGEAVVHLCVTEREYVPFLDNLIYEPADDGPGVVLLEPAREPVCYSGDMAGIMSCLCDALTDEDRGIAGAVIESSDNDHKSGEIYVEAPQCKFQIRVNRI